MKTLTYTQHHTRVTIEAEEWCFLALELGRLSPQLTVDEVDEVISLAYQESKVIGSGEYTAFTEYKDGQYVAQLFNDSWIVITDGKVSIWNDLDNLHDITLFVEATQL